MTTTPAGTTPLVQSGLKTRAIHVFVLYYLAIVVRLFDVLGSEPAFFVAHGSGGPDILVLVLIIGVLLPGSLVLLEWLVGLFGRRLAVAFHLSIVFLCVAAVAMAGLARFSAINPWVYLAGVLISAALTTAAYGRFAAVRTLATILCPIVVLSPALLLFGSATSKLLFYSSERAALAVRVGRPAPLIVVLCDEFCGTSLMNEDRRIDAARYPNLAKLAGDGVWFRNATTNSYSTHPAVCSLVTGKYPPEITTLFTAAGHPENLFNLLAGSHEIAAWEEVTRFCPSSLNRNRTLEVGLWRRIESLLADAAVVELHWLLPSAWRGRLPPLMGRWENFLEERTKLADQWTVEDRRIGQFREFVRSIHPTERPGLYFAHVMLPHVPWTYLPSGKEYPIPAICEKMCSPNSIHYVAGLATDYWIGDDTALTKAHARYLLQVQMVDHLIGELVEHLRRAGMYDESLIVVVADHGVSFRPGDYRRTITDSNYPDILSIPLVIKPPGNMQGETSDRNVESIDILPTIAELLQIEGTWETDGASAFGTATERPTKQVATDEHSTQRVRYDAAFQAKYESLQWMLDRFGSGDRRKEFFAVAPYAELVGRPVTEFLVEASPRSEIELVAADAYDDVRLDQPRIPCHLGGTLRPAPELGHGPIELAVAINGTIQAVTRTMKFADFEDSWMTLVSEESLREGKNEVEVFVISKKAQAIRLLRTLGKRIP